MLQKETIHNYSDICDEMGYSRKEKAEQNKVRITRNHNLYVKKMWVILLNILFYIERG